MAAGATVQEPKRTAIIFTFGAFGPASGCFASLAALVIGSGNIGGLTMQAVLGAVGVAYLVGAIPALFAGIFYALVPPPWQRIVLSPLFGAIPSAAAAALMGFSEPYFYMIAAAIVGAAAALICAIAVRVLGYDARGAPRVEVAHA